MGEAGLRRPPRRALRVRLRRHELPRRPRGARPRRADEGDAVPRRSRSPSARAITSLRAGRRRRSAAPSSSARPRRRSSPSRLRRRPARGARGEGARRRRRRGRATCARRSASRSTSATPNELADKIEKALKALAGGKPAAWRPLRGQGIFRGSGPAPKVAFLFTGQGSQYVNMARALRDLEPVVAETFAQADRKMEPILGRTLSSYLFVDAQGRRRRGRRPRRSSSRPPSRSRPSSRPTSPSRRLLGAYGIAPDMVMGHSLGEYGALVAAGVLPFEDALEAVAARGREMSRVSVADNGKMAAVFAPVAEIERTLEGDRAATSSSRTTTATARPSSAARPPRSRPRVEAFQRAGVTAVAHPGQPRLPHEDRRAGDRPVHAASSSGSASRRRSSRSSRTSRATSTRRTATSRPKVIDLLSRAGRLARPVREGARDALRRRRPRLRRGRPEEGRSRASSRTSSATRPDVHSLATNHPRLGDVVAFNQAICGFYAAGLGAATAAEATRPSSSSPRRRASPRRSSRPRVRAPSPPRRPPSRLRARGARPRAPAARATRSATSASSSPSSSRRG